jgi:hypothetical protein
MSRRSCVAAGTRRAAASSPAASSGREAGGLLFLSWRCDLPRLLCSLPLPFPPSTGRNGRGEPAFLLLGQRWPPLGADLTRCRGFRWRSPSAELAGALIRRWPTREGRGLLPLRRPERRRPRARPRQGTCGSAGANRPERCTTSLRKTGGTPPLLRAPSVCILCAKEAICRCRSACLLETV